MRTKNYNMHGQILGGGTTNRTLELQQTCERHKNTKKIYNCTVQVAEERHTKQNA
jgi:hypothetical protein